MIDCIFCKIANKEIPTDLIYEDEEFVAFSDIEPIAPTHVLVIPKEHHASMLEIDNTELIGKAYAVVRKLAHDMDLCKSGCRIITNAGDDAGQTVHHWHIHLIGGCKLGNMA